jgi:hypothetical protein
MIRSSSSMVTRYDAGTIHRKLQHQHEPHRRDLNLQDIESVDVVKGHLRRRCTERRRRTASSLSRRSAARAVAKTRWTAFGEQGLVEQPNEFTDNWRSWGRNLNSAGQPTGGAIQCTIARSALQAVHDRQPDEETIRT